MLMGQYKEGQYKEGQYMMTLSQMLSLNILRG